VESIPQRIAELHKKLTQTKKKDQENTKPKIQSQSSTGLIPQNRVKSTGPRANTILSQPPQQPNKKSKFDNASEHHKF
jgi:hypothetical protein